MTGVGTVTLQATQATAGTYTAGSATAVFQVTQATPTITGVPGTATALYGSTLGSAFTPSSGSIAGSFTYLITPSSGSAISGSAATVLPAGNYAAQVTFTSTDSTDYKTATANLALVINKASLILKAADATRVYGVANPVFATQVTGAVNGDVLTGSAISAATLTSNAGTYAIVPAVAGSAAGNYTVTASKGTLTVSQADASFHAQSRIGPTPGRTAPRIDPTTSACCRTALPRK